MSYTKKFLRRLARSILALYALSVLYEINTGEEWPTLLLFFIAFTCVIAFDTGDLDDRSGGRR